MRRPVLLAAALANLAPAPASQDQQTRVYDLRDLTTPRASHAYRDELAALPLPVGPALLLNDGARADVGLFEFVATRTPHVDAEQLLDWLRQVAGDDLQLSDSLGLQRITGSAGAHARVRSALQVAQGVRQRRVQLTLHLLPPSAGSDSAAALTAEQVDALLAASPPLRSVSASLPADEPWIWSSGRSVRIVRDFDVEVAQKAQIADPKPDSYFVGTRCTAAATPLIDGRVLLRVGLRDTNEPKGPRVRVLSGAHLGRMHLPDLSVEETRTSVVLTAGGGLLLAADRERGTWLLRARPTAPAAAVAGMVAVPSGALAVTPLPPLPRRDLVRRAGEEDVVADDEQPPAPDLLEAVKGLLGGLEAREANLLQIGSHLVLVDEPTLQAKLEKALQQEAKAHDTISVEFRVGKLANDVATKHLTGQLSESDLAAMLPRGGVLGAMPQHPFAMVAGRETAIVRDLEVEIAAKASMANPIVDLCESGVHLRGELRQNLVGELRLHLDLRYADLLPFEPFEFGNAALGDIDLPTTAWTEFADDFPLRKGEWQIVHVGAEPALVEARSLVVAVRVR